VKKVLLSVFVAVLAAGFVAPDVEARRLGGGTTSGMKRRRQPLPLPLPQRPSARGSARSPVSRPAWGSLR